MYKIVAISHYKNARVTVIDQCEQGYKSNKLTVHQTQSVVATATRHAVQRMAGRLGQLAKEIKFPTATQTQAIATATQTQAIANGNPNTGKSPTATNTGQSTYNHLRGRGTGLYRLLGNHSHSDVVFTIYDWTGGS